MNKHKAFTLIELLVVIAIIALLMAILMPALRRVKEQARTVVCRSHLQQWSLCLAMYTSDYDGRFMPGIDEDWATGRFSWIYTLIPYHKDADIRLCPRAKRTIEEGGTLPWTAWNVSLTNPADFSYLKDPLYKIGSYGINWWVNDSDLVNGAHDPKNKWRRTGQKNPSGIPVLMDCGFMLVRAEPVDPPPEQDGEFLWAFGGGMRRVCTNRHNGSVNILFMDFSTDKIGLKELWRFKWHRTFDTANAWTSAGAVMPEDWPDWMRNFKNY
ncbi:MAG TPA: type II secretion system protein [Sedimentisphaerales bacterium]|nr:type II secretion system protein [Sedimentisphaerales bacterium]